MWDPSKLSSPMLWWIIPHRGVSPQWGRHSAAPCQPAMENAEWVRNHICCCRPKKLWGSLLQKFSLLIMIYSEIATRNGWHNNQTPKICSTGFRVVGRRQKKHSLGPMASWSVLYSDVTFGLMSNNLEGRTGTTDLMTRGERESRLSVVHVTLVLITFDKALKERWSQKTSSFYK